MKVLSDDETYEYACGYTNTVTVNIMPQIWKIKLTEFKPLFE